MSDKPYVSQSGNVLSSSGNPVSEPTTESLVERVREGLHDGGNGHRYHDGLASLTALQSRCEELERERDEIQSDWTKMYNTKEDERARAERAEAEVQRLREALRAILVQTTSTRIAATARAALSEEPRT